MSNQSYLHPPIFLGEGARALEAQHRVHIGWPTAYVWREVACP
jgi:hypothetical protein